MNLCIYVHLLIHSFISLFLCKVQLMGVMFLNQFIHEAGNDGICFMRRLAWEAGWLPWDVGRLAEVGLGKGRP